jgi:hypothetical protein
VRHVETDAVEIVAELYC